MVVREGEVGTGETGCNTTEHRGVEGISHINPASGPNRQKQSWPGECDLLFALGLIEAKFSACSEVWFFGSVHTQEPLFASTWASDAMGDAMFKVLVHLP